MAKTINRRLAELIDGSGQLTAGKLPNAFITTAHYSANSITDAKLHTSFSLPASALTARDTGDLSEGSNLYYTDARVGTYISGNRTFGNITTTGYIAGPASMVIDPAGVGDNTGTVVIAGNLQVDGTTTTINSTTVSIDDLNFTIASDAADSSAANGAGITIGGASATMLYTHATTSFDFNKPVNVTGAINSTGTGRAIQVNGTTRINSVGDIIGTSYYVGANAIVDTNRNLVNIGTISSGTITVNQNINSSTGNPLVLTGDGGANIELYGNGNAYFDATQLHLRGTNGSGGGALAIAGTTVIDGARNLVDIGTISAAGLLTVNNNIKFGASTNRSLLTSNAVYSYIGQTNAGTENPESNSAYFFGINPRMGTDRTLVVEARTADGAGNIVFKAGSGSYSTGAPERMRITSDGTVGIGATSGHANLVVRDRVDGTHKGGRIGFGIHEAGALQIYDAVTMSKTAGSVVTDSTASGGQNVTLSSGQLYGPYHTLPRGSYRLCVKMKTTNAAYTGSAARLTLHVASSTVIPESRTVRGVDFGTNNKWQSFSVPFQVVGAATNAVEFYLFALNSQAISVDYFFIMNDTDSYSTKVYGDQIVDGNVGIGTTNPFSSLQSGNNTFSGTHGMYADARVGISNHGELTGMMLASTYNDAAHPEYGLVFVQGPSTSSYNVWSISPDGPAKGNGLNFHYGSGVTNIHAPGYAKVTFKGDGKVGIGTDSPANRLHIDYSVSTSAANLAESKSTAAIAYYPLRNSSDYGMYFGNNGTSAGYVQVTNGSAASTMNINPYGGNVGIGTTGPSALLEIASGAPTLILNANTQATNKKKVRIAVSQHTAGDFNIQQMNDNGTTVAQQALLITNAGDMAVGGTGSPNAPTQKQNTTITSSNSPTGTWTSPAAGGTYNYRNSIEVGGILNRHIGKWGFSGNFSANTWYPFVKRSELTSMYRAASGSEDGFTLYFRIYLYPTTSGIGEYFSNRMSEMVYIQSSGSNSVTWHELRVGAGWGHAPNAGTDFDPDGRFSGFGPVRLRIQHHLGSDSNFPAEQTIDINFASAVTGLNPSVAGRQVLIYGYML